MFGPSVLAVCDVVKTRDSVATNNAVMFASRTLNCVKRSARVRCNVLVPDTLSKLEQYFSSSHRNGMEKYKRF
jgi:acyl-CoA hydrolase